MTMKEKVENIIGDFFERNKQYVIEVYIRMQLLVTGKEDIL